MKLERFAVTEDVYEPGGVAFLRDSQQPAKRRAGPAHACVQRAPVNGHELARAQRARDFELSDLIQSMTEPVTAVAFAMVSSRSLDLCSNSTATKKGHM